MTPTRDDIDQYLKGRGYRAFPVPDIDRHDRNWQLTYREEGRKRFIDIREWQHDKPGIPERFHSMPDGYEIGACFDAGAAWVKVYFYTLKSDELAEHLPGLEARLKSLIAQWGVARDG